MTAETKTVPVNPSVEDFQKAAVQCMLGAYDIDTLAAMHGISDDEATAMIETNAGAISQGVAQAVADGRDVPAMAKRTLVEVLGNLDKQVRNGNLSPGTLLKAAETLNKISGLEAKQRVQPEQSGRFVFTIHLGDDAPGHTITVDSQRVDDDLGDTPEFMKTLAVAGVNLNAGGEYE